MLFIAADYIFCRARWKTSMEAFANLRDDAVVVEKAKAYWSTMRTCVHCGQRFNLFGSFAKWECKYHPGARTEVFFYAVGETVTTYNEAANEKLLGDKAGKVFASEDEAARHAKMLSRRQNIYYDCCYEAVVCVPLSGSASEYDVSRQTYGSVRASKFSSQRNWGYTCNSLVGSVPNKKRVSAISTYVPQGCVGRDHTHRNNDPVNISNISALLPFIEEPGERNGFKNIEDNGLILRDQGAV